MNAWDLDPNLYAPLWRSLRNWYRRRKPSPALSRPAHPKPGPHAGCRA